MSKPMRGGDRSARLAQTRALTEDIQGWLLEDEGRLLYRLGERCQGRGAIVEIGSWQGKSTVWLARGSQAGVGTRVVTVDPHTGSAEHREWYGAVDTFEAFQKNLIRAGVQALVEPLRLSSEQAGAAFAGPIELLFIDGNHAYEAVRRDFELWSPKLIYGGTIALHDTTSWSGPAAVAEQAIFRSRQFAHVGLVRSITYATRVESNSYFDRLRNRAVRVRWRRSIRRRRRKGKLH